MQTKQAPFSEKQSQSTADTLNKLSEEDRDLIKQDYDMKQIVENLKIDTNQDVDKAIAQIKEWFLLDEIRYTNMIIDKLELRVKELKKSGNSGLAAYLEKQLADNYEIRYQKRDFASIQNGNKIYEEMETDTSSWNKFINGDDLKVWYRKRPEGGLFDFYYEKICNAPIENVVCVIREAQTFKTWVPMLYESRFIYETSDSQLFGEVKVRMPWPIKNRVLYVSSNALINNESVDVNLLTVPEEVYLADKKIEKDKSCVEVDCQCMLLKVQRLSKNKQKLRVLKTIDPKCDNMPDWLLNNISKILAAAFMTQVAKRSESLYTYDIYKEIMVQKKAYYDLLQKKLDRRRLQALVDDIPDIEQQLFRPKCDSKQSMTGQFGLDSASEKQSAKSVQHENEESDDDVNSDSNSDSGNECDLDESTWIDTGDCEGHITNRAVVNQNVKASMDRPKGADYNQIQYQKGTFQFKVAQDDPNRSDLQDLIQVDGKETDQKAIQKQLKMLENRYNQQHNFTSSKQKVMRLIAPKTKCHLVNNFMSKNNRENEENTFFKKQDKMMIKIEKDFKQLNLSGMGKRKQSVPNLQHLQKPLTDLQMKPQITEVQEKWRKKSRLISTKLSDDSPSTTSNCPATPNNLAGLQQQKKTKSKVIKRRNSLSSGFFVCCKSNAKQVTLARPAKWEAIE